MTSRSSKTISPLKYWLTVLLLLVVGIACIVIGIHDLRHPDECDGVVMTESQSCRHQGRAGANETLLTEPAEVTGAKSLEQERSRNRLMGVTLAMVGTALVIGGGYAGKSAFGRRGGARTRDRT